MTKDKMDPEKLRRQIDGTEEDEDPGLLPVTTSFDIDYEIKEGPRRGSHLKGRFEFAVPAAGKQIEIARMKALYLPQGAAADPNGAVLVEMISYLECTLTHKPNWWKPTQFFDTGVINVVYGRCTAYEARFLGKKPFVQDDAESVQRTTQDEGTDGSDDPGTVDGNVLPSRKRREVLTPHDV